MKYRFYIVILLSVLCTRMSAAYYSVNIDYETAAAMLAAYNAEGAMELMGDESVRVMLKHYKNAELATAGIFLTKYMPEGSVMQKKMPIISVSIGLSARTSFPKHGMSPSCW